MPGIYRSLSAKLSSSDVSTEASSAYDYDHKEGFGGHVPRTPRNIGKYGKTYATPKDMRSSRCVKEGGQRTPSSAGSRGWDFALDSTAGGNNPGRSAASLQRPVRSASVRSYRSDAAPSVVSSAYDYDHKEGFSGHMPKTQRNFSKYGKTYGTQKDNRSSQFNSEGIRYLPQQGPRRVVDGERGWNYATTSQQPTPGGDCLTLHLTSGPTPYACHPSVDSVAPVIRHAYSPLQEGVHLGHRVPQPSGGYSDVSVSPRWGVPESYDSRSRSSYPSTYSESSVPLASGDPRRGMPPTNPWPTRTVHDRSASPRHVQKLLTSAGHDERNQSAWRKVKEFEADARAASSSRRPYRDGGSSARLDRTPSRREGHRSRSQTPRPRSQTPRPRSQTPRGERDKTPRSKADARSGATPRTMTPPASLTPRLRIRSVASHSTNSSF
eukprot:TRINITY_DN30132_c0_g1_i1.p1 TRINITY_DN30132_c0_g1~~TRINITY_DN30132_c0_g1_i1.p1  ORF type:complete len:437 (-),score=35.25 TRINITY_DN30132_c0_g1_i1:50-1360(-)